jgi:hypothetical protein
MISPEPPQPIRSVVFQTLRPYSIVFGISVVIILFVYLLLPQSTAEKTTQMLISRCKDKVSFHSDTAITPTVNTTSYDKTYLVRIDARGGEYTGAMLCTLMMDTKGSIWTKEFRATADTTLWIVKP